jgi:hypothetical protein
MRACTDARFPAVTCPGATAVLNPGAVMTSGILVCRRDRLSPRPSFAERILLDPDTLEVIDHLAPPRGYPDDTR